MVYLKRNPDPVLYIALLALVLFYGAGLVDFSIQPAEDAAILMRYADHLARGYGIVWNIGQPPVDGATDFLFTVAVSALMKVGLPLGRAVRGLGIAAHILTVLLVYWVNRRLWQANILLSFLAAAYLAVGPGLTYVAAYFGTPFFALFSTLTWTMCLLLIQHEHPSLRLCVAFALSGLLTGLVRPEGAILTLLMLVALVVAKGWRASRGIVAVVGIVFLVLGGVYFLWRWNYFGYPLPNPYYKKGGGTLHWDGLQNSFAGLIGLCGPFLLAYLPGFRSSKLARRTVACLFPVVGFASAFVLISDEMNFASRFQYALLPIVLTSWLPLVQGLNAELKLPSMRSLPTRLRLSIWAVLVATACALLYSSFKFAHSTPLYKDGRFDAAGMLAEYEAKGYTMATSEAGLLPLYSKWNAVDTWGLNDAWIAHHGLVTEEYLDRYKPQLIIFHAKFSPLVPPLGPERYPDPDWFKMTMVLKDYAEKNHYLLAAVFGESPFDTHYYYVRPDFPDSQEIAHRLSNMKYFWYGRRGLKALNYAEAAP